MNLKKAMAQMGHNAQQAAKQLATVTDEQKNQSLLAMADAIENHKQDILIANQKDIQAAQNAQLSPAMIDRLKLNPERIKAMANALRAIVTFPDPVHRVLAAWDAPSGLHIKRISIPLGVIGVIYESRPNVTADAAALCLKAGNAVILRGGSESMHSNQAIMACLQAGLQTAGLPQSAIQYVPSQDRDAVGILLTMNDSIDVLIPRGGPSLVKRVIEESRIPLFQHLQGICHTYVHHKANFETAMKVVLNAKMRRTGICGATETLLIDKDIANQFLPELIPALQALKCEVRGCKNTQALDSSVVAATEQDWQTEYLDAILSIKIVDDIHEAIEHIQQFSSSHTESIISEDADAVQLFMNHIHSAIVMHNTSTQFADGGEFGMGAEIGISTGKLHARGPVGIEQLTTFQYQVTSAGLARP